MIASEQLPPATSVTHLHLLACANTELTQRAASDSATVRILDAGCGDGRLLAYLHECLSRLHPGWTLELHGFDVIDHGVQQSRFMERTVGSLRERCPAVDWGQCIAAIRANDPWPFEPQSFDLVLSNQVLEHVQDHARFFAESHRVLRPQAHAIHLFPLAHYVYEGHLHLPWVHRIGSHDLRVAYIQLLSRLGLGKYRAHRRDSAVSLVEFSERHADYIAFWTHYLKERQALELTRRAGFRSCLRYTSDFYAQKLRLLARRPVASAYRHADRGLWDSVSAKLLRYVSSVTLVCHKDNRY